MSICQPVHQSAEASYGLDVSEMSLELARKTLKKKHLDLLRKIKNIKREMGLWRL